MFFLRVGSFYVVLKPKGYWCHVISPIFFSRSVRSRHVTKAEARRRRDEAQRQHKDEKPAEPGATPTPVSVGAALVAGAVAVTSNGVSVEGGASGIGACGKEQ